jgi:hypothetical protein
MRRPILLNQMSVLNSIHEDSCLVVDVVLGEGQIHTHDECLAYTVVTQRWSFKGCVAIIAKGLLLYHEDLSFVKDWYRNELSALVVYAVIFPI